MCFTQVLNDFTCAVMTNKPKNIYKFARFWFTMSLPPVPLVNSGETTNVAATPDVGSQSLEQIMSISVHRLLAHVYRTIDVDQDTQCTMAELERSPFHNIWPQNTWTEMKQSNKYVNNCQPLTLLIRMIAV